MAITGHEVKEYGIDVGMVSRLMKETLVSFVSPGYQLVKDSDTTSTDSSRCPNVLFTM